MNRRGFLTSMLALAAAPAIVRADSLMRIVPPEVEVLTFASYDIVIDQGPSYRALREQALVDLTEWWGRAMDGGMVRALLDSDGRVLSADRYSKSPFVLVGEEA